MLKSIATIVLATVFLGCGSFVDDGGNGDGDEALTTKLINLGTYALTSFYCQPTNSMPEQDWESADWGSNLLPVAQLNELEFVLLETIPRENLDCMASFDAAGQVIYRRNNAVRADWKNDPELTIYFSINATSEGVGYGWGIEEAPGEVDVTP
jgi:hypothetical protein